MRNLRVFASRLDRRQFIAAIVAATGLAVILVAVMLHSTLPGFLPGGGARTIGAGNGITVEEPTTTIPQAEPVELGSPGTGPVANVGSTPPTPGPGGTTPTSRPPQPTTTTTAPPPSTTSTTLPPIIPGIPIGGLGLGG